MDMRRSRTRARAPAGLAIDPSEVEKTLEMRPRRRDAGSTQEILADDILEAVDHRVGPTAVAVSARRAPAPQPKATTLPTVIVRRDSVAPSPYAHPIIPSLPPVAVDLSFDLPALDPEAIELVDDEPLPAIPRRRLGWVVASAVGIALVVLGVGFARRAWVLEQERPTLATLIAAPPKPPAPAPAPLPPPAAASATASGPPVVDVNSLPVAPKVGTVVGPVGRVYIDGAVVRAKSAIVPCGVHAIRVAPAWSARKLDVPCGGEIVVR